MRSVTVENTTVTLLATEELPLHTGLLERSDKQFAYNLLQIMSAIRNALSNFACSVTIN